MTRTRVFFNIAIASILLFLVGIVEPAWAGPFRITSGSDYKVIFATTRYNESTSKRHPVYKSKRHLDTGNGSIDYGYVKIKKPGGLTATNEASSWADFKLRLKTADIAWSKASVSGANGLNKDEFEKLISSWSGAICLFIHGYDESLEETVQDTAVIASELERKAKGTKILPVLLSWPSANSSTDYTVDEANLHWSKLPFRKLIERIAARKKANTKLFLVAHSLGSRAAFDLPNSQFLNSKPLIDKIVISSSDFDYYQALQRRSMLEKLVKEKIYIFVSDRDGALMTSQLLHGSPRLGRPLDASKVSNKLTIKEPKTYKKKSFWKGILSEAVDMIYPPTSYEDPQTSSWVNKGRSTSIELGPKSRFIDVTELVTRDFGHRLAWPVISSLLATNGSLYPLGTTTVHKKPDKLFLEQSGGTPKYVFKFHRITKNNFRTK